MFVRSTPYVKNTKLHFKRRLAEIRGSQLVTKVSARDSGKQGSAKTERYPDAELEDEVDRERGPDEDGGAAERDGVELNLEEQIVLKNSYSVNEDRPNRDPS